MAVSLGVCSWSLHPESPADLVDKIKQTALSAVQLALEPIRSGAWSEVETRNALRDAGITVLSGMMQTQGEDYSTLESIKETGGFRPDAHWMQNQETARECAILARRWGLSLVTLHAGFIPEEAGDPLIIAMHSRLRTIAAEFRRQGIVVGLETGQESAGTLQHTLEALDQSNVGVNFDPANMILYAKGDPVDALERLAPWVRQIHIKDATSTQTPGTWGEEVPAGKGEVDWERFFAVCADKDLDVDLVIEREAGDQRILDIRNAADVVRKYVSGVVA